jgi:hypothetical protein
MDSISAGVGQQALARHPRVARQGEGTLAIGRVLQIGTVTVQRVVREDGWLIEQHCALKTFVEKTEGRA